MWQHVTLSRDNSWTFSVIGNSAFGPWTKFHQKEMEAPLWSCIGLQHYRLGLNVYNKELTVSCAGLFRHLQQCQLLVVCLSVRWCKMLKLEFVRVALQRWPVLQPGPCNLFLWFLVDLRLGASCAKMEYVKITLEQFHCLYWTQSSRGGLSCIRSIITCFCTLAASSHSKWSSTFMSLKPLNCRSSGTH